jgi:hypothetical protein
MGLLTWGTWDSSARPVQERVQDFTSAYPPPDPAKFQGSVLKKTKEGDFGPAGPEERRRRFEKDDGPFGSLAEVLARYGLKLVEGPVYVPRLVGVPPFREVARLRNQRLRGLHGAVDIEPENMDDAKAAELERLEKKRAAEQIREARERMRWEVEGGK